MIKSIDFNSTRIRAGQDIVVGIDASYPVVIEIKCFVTQPPPPRFVPCPNSGRHTLINRVPFRFSTDIRTFQNSGHIEFRITDNDFDTQIHKIEVKA